MSPEARDELILAIWTFANPHQRRSLKDFQCLAGWINWALNVFPLLCPGLSGIYNKMRCGSYPFQKLCLNNTICSELHWLADHISTSNGVHIIKSREGPRSEAHNMFLCDACPTGMGYWSPRTCEGSVCAVSPLSWNGIFFFEALTVLSALSHVCESVILNPYRLAILTDSSNTFNMFNSLHALPAYNPILIMAINLLIMSGIQLCVFHVLRGSNKVADALSHLDVVTAMQLQLGLVVTKFSPPQFMLGEVRLWSRSLICPGNLIKKPGHANPTLHVLLNPVWFLPILLQ